MEEENLGRSLKRKKKRKNVKKVKINVDRKHEKKVSQTKIITN
jgi:hypothetical protein